MASIIDSHYVDREVIGFVEPVVIVKSIRTKQLFEARIDSGATRCSIDESVVKKMGLGPIDESESVVINANGRVKRKTIELTFILAGKTITDSFTIADRSRLRYPVLIGRNALRHGFLIDPNKRARTIPKDQTKLKGFSNKNKSKGSEK